MADANDDIKNRLGAEYDLYSGLKDKFQGFDKDGNAVFKDDNGEVSSFNKSDFSAMNEQLKKDYGEKSYEDVFNKNQYEDLAKQGNKFQGFAGNNAIFRNEKGDLENFGSEGGFASFLKKQNPNAAFDISKQGQSQRTNTGYTAGANFLANREVAKQKTGSGFTGYNPQAALQSLGGAMMNPQPDLKSSVNPNIAKANNPGGTFQSFKAKQPTAPKPPAPPVQEEQSSEEYAPPSLGDMAKQMALKKAGDEFASLKNKGINLLEARKDEAQNAANSAISQATGLSTQMLTNPADAAKQAVINKAAGVTGIDASYANLLQGDVAKNVQNLAVDKAKDAGMDYLKTNDPIGLSQYANLVNGNIVDSAKNMAINKAKSTALDYLKQNDPTGGALKGLSPYASLLNGNIVDNAKNMAIDKTKTKALDYLKQNDPTKGAFKGLSDYAKYAQYADVLKGDVSKNVQNLAINKAKEKAVQEGLTAAGLDPTGGIASGALNVGNSLFSGGSSEDKGRAAAQAAARAAASYLTGGISNVVNPETLGLASAGLSNIKNSKTLNQAGVAGDVGKGALGLGSGMASNAAKAGNLAMESIGDIGASTGRSFKGVTEGVKNLTKGNIAEGLKGLGGTAVQSAIDNFIKNPINAAKKAASFVGDTGKKVLNAINIFCFAPDTKILMADGKYKKIKDIRLGDEVMLGGKVTAIGQSTSDDMYLYDGVEVSGGHTLYEDGKWIRTKDSKYAVKIEVEDYLVYPMDTENHLIVTKGQVWADMSEVDDTYDKTDTDILAQLNSQTEANRKIDLFLALYFKQKSK